MSLFLLVLLWVWCIILQKHTLLMIALENESKTKKNCHKYSTQWGRGGEFIIKRLHLSQFSFFFSPSAKVFFLLFHLPFVLSVEYLVLGMASQTKSNGRLDLKKKRSREKLKPVWGTGIHSWAECLQITRWEKEEKKQKESVRLGGASEPKTGSGLYSRSGG